MQCSYNNCKTNITQCGVCNMILCNNITKNYSHIVFHLTKSKHRSILINKKQLMCCICEDNLVFRLEIITGEESKNKKYNIMCKNCCNKVNMTNKKREPLIDEGRINNILINSEESDMDPKKMTKMNKKGKRLRKSTTFFTENDYKQTFEKMILVERQEEKILTESINEENVLVEFIISGYDLFAHFKDVECTELKFKIGDELIFTTIHGSVLMGRIICILNQIKVKIHKNKKIIFMKNSGTNIIIEKMKINIKWKDVSYTRMLDALYKINKCDLFDLILTGGNTDKDLVANTNKNGKKKKGEKPKNSSVSNINTSALKDKNIKSTENIDIDYKLNDSQRAAVRVSMGNRLTLVQGPPGTGKTVTSAEIVKCLIKLNYKVLVVAPSNIAVDNVTAAINLAGVSVVRVMAKSREDADCTVSRLCLHVWVNEYLNRQKLDPNDVNDTFKIDIKMAILSRVNCVTTTCTTSGSSIFKKIKFDAVLIDESTQATEPQSLIPLIYGCKKLILVGDHKQLGPRVLNSECDAAGLNISLFERCLKMGVTPLLLNIQYRMHPSLVEFPNIKFYDNRIINGVLAINRNSVILNNMFYCSYGKEEINVSGTSYFNKAETIEISNIITYLMKKKVKLNQIAVITFYEGQRDYLQTYLHRDGKCVEVINVDGFQGRERDYVIVSLVRSNEHIGIGFLKNERRVNVALTRARHGLIIVGNPNTMLKDSLWKEILEYYDSKGWIYDGPINDLRPISLKKYAYNFQEMFNVLDADDIKSVL